MGTTAEKIARHVAAQAKAPVIDLAGHRQMKQILRDAKLDAGSFEWRIAEGVDPCCAVYMHAQALISITAEELAATKEARQFARLAAEAEDIYMPSCPPMSPVTTSHFTMWSLFDLQFGQSHETILDRLVHTAHRIALTGDTLRDPQRSTAKRGKLDTPAAG